MWVLASLEVGLAVPTGEHMHVIWAAGLQRVVHLEIWALVCEWTEEKQYILIVLFFNELIYIN